MSPLFSSINKFLLFFLLIACSYACVAQTKWRYNAQVNLGCHFNFTYGKAQKFPGLKIFSGASINGVYDGHFMVNYGPSISLYTKTTGANLNPLVGDIQIDFTNSFSLGFAWAGDEQYMKYFRTLHTGDFYNVATNKENFVLLTSNFILNNHKRNQVVGSASVCFSNLTFNYYNDGAFPFDKIPLADNFDRYWTGGGEIFLHNNKGYNTGELGFDQFTGYTPLLYEVSNLLGINIPLYDEKKSNEENGKKHPYTFNTSSYNLKIFLDKNYAVSAGLVGSLIKNNVHFGVQDLIHMALRMSLHPNNDINRVYLGFNYNNLQHVKL